VTTYTIIIFRTVVVSVNSELHQLFQVATAADW